MKLFVSLIAIGWLFNKPEVLITFSMVAVGAIVLCARFLARFPFGVMAPPTTWARIEPRFDDALHYGYQAERASLLSRLDQLERDLIEAHSEADVLRYRNEQLERDVRAAEATARGDSTNPVYRRVGLHQGAPDWVVMAVRRAYRSRLHPDRYSTRLKPDAERRFKEAEAVFDQIYSQRGMVP